MKISTVRMFVIAFFLGQASQLLSAELTQPPRPPAGDVTYTGTITKSRVVEGVSPYQVDIALKGHAGSPGGAWGCTGPLNIIGRLAFLPEGQFVEIRGRHSSANRLELSSLKGGYEPKPYSPPRTGTEVTLSGVLKKAEILYQYRVYVEVEGAKGWHCDGHVENLAQLLFLKGRKVEIVGLDAVPGHWRLNVTSVKGDSPTVPSLPAQPPASASPAPAQPPASASPAPAQPPAPPGTR